MCSKLFIFAVCTILSVVNGGNILHPTSYAATYSAIQHPLVNPAAPYISSAAPLLRSSPYLTAATSPTQLINGSPYITRIASQPTPISSPYLASPYSTAPLAVSPYSAAPLAVSPYSAAPLAVSPYSAGPFASQYIPSPYSALPYAASPFNAPTARFASSPALIATSSSFPGFNPYF